MCEEVRSVVGGWYEVEQTSTWVEDVDGQWEIEQSGPEENQGGKKRGVGRVEEKNRRNQE